MSLILRALLCVVSVVSLFYVARKIKKSQVQVYDTVFWLLLSFGLMIISVFPGIPIYFAEIIGVQSPVNFVYLCVIFLMLIKCFQMSIRLSKLEERISVLVEELAIREHERDERGSIK